MKSNYELLISRINEFIQKFYLNKLLRGSIYTAALLLALYLFLFTLVYYTQPGPGLKSVLFFGFLTIALFLIALLIGKPALSYFKLGKHLNAEQAATIIGDHFAPIKDKLLNTLQLKTMADQSQTDNSLILAGIDQKILELRPIPFASAIKLTDNRKYIKYFLAPAAIILLIGIISPAILKEGTSSFIQYNKQIEPVAPFHFSLLNKTLRVTQGDDIELKLQLNGNEIPQEVYVSDGVNTYKLEKESKVRFNYTFKNLQKDQQLRFQAGGFNSSPFFIEVKPRPSIVKLDALLTYPAYLNKKKEVIVNVGDLLVPEGTQVSWSMRTENSDALVFNLNARPHLLQSPDNTFRFDQQITQAGNYTITPQNSFVQGKEVLSHQINVIADEFPGINVTMTADSLSSKALYFSGNISDDHGFSALKFHFNLKEHGRLITAVSKSIPVKKNQLENSFFFFWDLKNELIKPGQVIEYYFEVWDNDGFHGPKATKSTLQLLEIPGQQQVAEQLDQSSQALKQQMEKTIKMAGQVEQESKKLAETLLDKKQLTFDDKKQIEQLLDKQKQLENSVQELKNLNQKNTLQKEENNALKQEMAEKQKQIDELFKNVLNDQTKALLEKLQKLMDQNNKDQTQQELSKMQMDNKSVKNELDRILELYKQLEFEQGMKNMVDRLKELAKEQQSQAKKSSLPQTPLNDLKNKQQELSQSFDDIKKEMQKLDEKNQQLERPNPYQNPEKESKGIQQQQKNSEDKLNQSDKKAAAAEQQKAADKMEELARKMEEMQQESAEAENNVNAQELRQLLENLLKMSFEQEKVMLALKRINTTDPQYTSNVQKQRSVKDNMKTIADSLFALSKRVPQIESTVNTEMQNINFNIDKSLENLEERNTGAANRNQQYTMTAINNLSLMLNEALDQLQQMKKNSKGGGKGKPKQSMKQLEQMQQKLNEGMEKARQEMQKSGNKGSVPKGAMSEEFAKMAQQQQMIREALQKINREDNKDGKGPLGNLNQLVEDMKKTESELVNKRIEQESMNRQKELLTKLLDADKAQRQQDQDSKRESKAGKDLPPSYPKMLEKFKALERSKTEWLQKLPPNLNPYYKNKITEYFKLLNSGQ
jgi:hypothetical protein